VLLAPDQTVQIIPDTLSARDPHTFKHTSVAVLLYGEQALTVVSLQQRPPCWQRICRVSSSSMMREVVAAGMAIVAMLATACDDKNAKQDDKAAASASANPPPVKASATPPASVAPSASVAEPPSKDVSVTVRDPAAEPKKTVAALFGGSVKLFLPEFANTKWTVVSADKALGKPKEETIPGFVGATPAKQLTWVTNSPALKTGQSYPVQLANTKKGAAKPDKTFVLTIEMK
jgi:hypothetical protein